jgi:hypothetical protein
MTSLKQLSLYNIPPEARKVIKEDENYEIYQDIIQREIDEFRKSTKSDRQIVSKLLKDNISLFKILRLLVYIISISKKLSLLSLNPQEKDFNWEKNYKNWNLFLYFYFPDIANEYEDGSYEDREDNWPKSMWSLYFTHKIVWFVYWKRLGEKFVNKVSDELSHIQSLNNDNFIKLINDFNSKEITFENTLFLAYKVFKFLTKNVPKDEMVDQGY